MQTDLLSAPAERSASSSAPETRLTRRSLFPSIAAAMTVGAASGTAGAAASPHPDAELLALFDEWQKQAKSCDAATQLEIEAEDRCVWPEPPEAIFARPGDRGLLLMDPPIRRGRGWWFPETQYLREAFSNCDLGQRIFQDRRNRANEIVAACDKWEEARARAAHESGFADVEAEAARLYGANNVLRERILEARASTLDGLLAKARVVRWCYTGTHEHFLEQIADDIEERGAGDHGISLSIVRDLICMNPRVDYA